MQPFNSENAQQLSQSINKNKTSTYYPADGGVIMKALNFLETQVFTNNKVQTVKQTPEEQVVLTFEMPLQAIANSEDDLSVDDDDVVKKPSIQKPTLKQ